MVDKRQLYGRGAYRRRGIALFDLFSFAFFASFALRLLPLVVSLGITPTYAQTPYPTRPIRIIVRGQNHAWSNRSNQPAVLAVSSHDGKL